MGLWPWVFWQPPWGCTFSTLPRTPPRTGLLPACASWWCLCAPSPICRGWVTHRTPWACYIWVLGSAMWWPGHRRQWSGGGPARPGWQSGSQTSHTPEGGRLDKGVRKDVRSWSLNTYCRLITKPFMCVPFHRRRCWSCSGRLSPRSAEIWTADRGCSHFPGPENSRWWGRRAGTLQRCETQARDTSCASPDCWLVWCSWRAPSLGRSLSALHSILHSGCSPAHAASHLHAGGDTSENGSDWTGHMVTAYVDFRCLKVV